MYLKMLIGSILSCPFFFVTLGALETVSSKANRAGARNGEGEIGCLPRFLLASTNWTVGLVYVLQRPLQISLVEGET